DFSLNILFFIGQEVINFSCSSDIVLAHQPVQTFTDSLTHGDLVHANIIRHQNYNIVQIGRNVVNITNQVQQFQHIHILCFDAITIISSLLAAFNYTADGAIQESMYGIIKTEERNESILVFVLNFLCCFLEAGKHGTFTAGQMLAGITMLADFCKNLLHDDELIRHKWEIHGKLSGTRITFNIQNGVCETEQITENGVVLLINCFQFGLGFIVLFQNTLLNDFIHRGGRKAQTGFESSLNSGELVSTDFNNFINSFQIGRASCRNRV